MYFKYKELLEPPVKRAAYSDRTAWLMAEMSRLAYMKFEENPDLREVFITSACLSMMSLTLSSILSTCAGGTEPTRTKFIFTVKCLR